MRGRTLQSLDFKWKYGLISADDLVANRRVLAALLRELAMVVGIYYQGCRHWDG